ncbi:transcription factor IIA, alpha/beta subunit, partial [Dimargaris cristalligena]
YQLVIDEVISAVQREFEDHGVDESVLQELQRSWEAKLIESRVAEFPHAPRAPPSGGGGSGEPPANGTGGHIPQHDGADDDERPSAPSTIRFTAYIPQVDGDFDDGLEPEADEDAINSDLDDSDDEEANTDQAGGEDTEHIILCQYDKVGRQKNRWKCVLKDGILLIDGKDYLFHKATGEFEW